MTVPARRSVAGRRAWLALAAGALALAGCAGSAVPERGEAGPARPAIVIRPGADITASARVVADRARTAEVVYLGELHDNPLHHAIQARVLEEMILAGARPAVAFEMIPETRQAALDGAIRSQASPVEVDRQLGWAAQGWPDFMMYWPLMDLARRHGLPVVATDLDPAVTRRISRDGIGASGEDPARLRSALPDDPARDQGIARRIRAAHCDRVTEGRTLRMVEAWYARNVVIARRLVLALRGAPQVVVIIGRGHQSPGGVPEQVEALRRGSRQLVVALADGEPGIPPEMTADIVWLTPARPLPDPCLSLPQRLGAIRVTPGKATR
jgi:uncharacterized iron-regulated protein